MSDEREQFAALTNAFIAQANQQLTSTNHTQVAMALLAAAARFNAYIVTAASGTPERAREEAPRASAFLVRQFEQTLAGNLDDYIANFDTYANTPAS